MTSAQPAAASPDAATGSVAVLDNAAVVDGVDVDAVAAAVARCAGVAALDRGRFGSVVTYLPGRTVAGVAVGGGRVTVQVRSRWGVPAPDLARAITTALAPLTGSRPIDVVIADIDDPPAPRSTAAAQPEPPPTAPRRGKPRRDAATQPKPGLPPV